MTENRRELKTRQKCWVKKLTKWLLKTNTTPNQISILSIVCAVIAGSLLSQFSHHHSVMYLFFGAVFIQLRLLCNMMDGLIAVEGGKGTRSGELFNDIPDRFADIFILIGAGYAISTPFAIGLGWTAALLAVLTAYVRTLGGSLGAPISFMGPMAKQHRMAVLTGGVLLAILETWVYGTQHLLTLVLLTIVIGTLLTIWRRSAMIYQFLEKEEPAN